MLMRNLTDKVSFSRLSEKFSKTTFLQESSARFRFCIDDGWRCSLYLHRAVKPSFNVYLIGLSYRLSFYVGGTLDATVHEMQEDGTIKEIHKLQGVLSLCEPTIRKSIRSVAQRTKISKSIESSFHLTVSLQWMSSKQRTDESPS